MTDFEQDPMDDLVRRALTREAERVRPDPDGLYTIRARGDAAGNIGVFDAEHDVAIGAAG